MQTLLCNFKTTIETNYFKKNLIQIFSFRFNNHKNLNLLKMTSIGTGVIIIEINDFI